MASNGKSARTFDNDELGIDPEDDFEDEEDEEDEGEEEDAATGILDAVYREPTRSQPDFRMAV